MVYILHIYAYIHGLHYDNYYYVNVRCYNLFSLVVMCVIFA